MSSRLVQRTREDWDERAKENAFYYIASSLEKFDERSFFDSGEREYRQYVEPVLQAAGFDPAGKTMLEVGCGAGRMTRSFATRFSRVLALDISPEMKMRGESYLAEFSNIEWLLGNGADLGPIDSQSVGFVFSYLVLQHLPTKTLAFHYMTEMMRTLEPGGFYLFQYNGEKLSAMNLKGRVVWGVVDGLWLAGLRRASQFIASLLGLDPKLAGKSWRGAALDAAEVSQTLRAAGASTIHTKGGSTPLAWAWGTKSKP